jgi:3'(2'), 5'-bisphosphate nucleotidase
LNDPSASEVRAATLATLVRIAEEAASLVAGIYHASSTAALEVEWKNPGDPVTRADREANALIVKALALAFPGLPIVAEESSKESYAGFTSEPYAFFVDPLDGTKDFVARTGEFAVMIGLVVRGKPALGVVTRPQPFVTYAGGPGVGVFRRARGATEHPFALTTNLRTLDQATVVVSRSHRSPAIDAALARLGACLLKPLGSAGLKAIAVATGDADLYVHPGQAGFLWDTAAPEAILRGAGAAVSDAYGNPLDYANAQLANHRGIVTGPMLLHGEAVRRLALREHLP